MATYAVGDVQGCISQLQHLLRTVGFAPQNDCLWLVGDLVNRGPDSLDTLRFIKNLPNKQVILGNHDLHLLALAKGVRKPNKKDTLNAIFQAEDCSELLDWLQQQPLMHHDEKLGYSMVHAGIPPQWTLAQAQRYAKEVETILCSEKSSEFFNAMYGNLPDLWNENLEGTERLRLITNYFTRMRFCSAEGQLELATKTGPDDRPAGFAPWFSHVNHQCANDKILFGHWASLQGVSNNDNFIALDSGCVWGGSLTAFRLEDATRTSVACDCGIPLEPEYT
ncbi:MAG: symmetrical bis(5'-nucleosyl)-tetraphosphatase [Agarilytica sp.]